MKSLITRCQIISDGIDDKPQELVFLQGWESVTSPLHLMSSALQQCKYSALLPPIHISHPADSKAWRLPHLEELRMPYSLLVSQHTCIMQSKAKTMQRRFTHFKA